MALNSQEKTYEALLELGNPSERRTRADLISLALRTSLALVDADAAAVVLDSSKSSKRRGERLVLHGGSSVAAAVPLPEEGSEVVASLMESWQLFPLADLSDNARFAEADACPGVEAGPVLFIPLRQRDPIPAYLAIYRRRGRARFTASEIQLLLVLGAWLSSSLENVRLSSGTERLAITDELTEVYNFRFLKTALRREIQRASRFHQELSLALIDVDRLKAFNDEHGYLRGSLLLKELASLLAQQVRSSDVLARPGDDQFMVILPQTNREGGAEVAERIRAAIERQAFTHAPAGTITVSVGLATFPHDGVEVRDLIAVAERVLQEAKEQGRNRVATPAQRAA